MFLHSQNTFLDMNRKGIHELSETDVTGRK